MYGRLREQIREHRALSWLLLGGFVVHFAAWIAYWPALFYSDSVSYADLAAHGGFSPTRQMAYSWILRVLTTIGGESLGVLAFVTALQHLAGLAVGVLTYAMLRRLDVARWLAVAGAGVFVLDVFAMSIEQQILSEGFYVLVLTASLALLVIPRKRTTGLIMLSGLLLGAAMWLRSAGMFAVPAWFAYVVWDQRAWRPVLAAVGALAVPVLIYSTIYWSGTGVFGFTQTSGWFMYGRVAEIANCKTADIPPGTTRLCPRKHHPGAAWYIWDYSSPAWKVYGRNPGGDPDRLTRFDRKLRTFAFAVIKDRPLAYAGLAATDFVRFFQPGLMKRGDNDDLTTTFGRWDPENNLNPPPPNNNQRTFDHYEPRQRWPHQLLYGYSKVFHMPRVPLGLLLIGGLLGWLVRPLRRQVRHVPEVALLLGSAFLVLAGHALTSDFAVRYLMPVVPLILAGGIPGNRWLWVRIRNRSRRIPARVVRSRPREVAPAEPAERPFASVP